MKKTLLIINSILTDNNYPAINEQTAKEWLIVGGESLEEIIAMTLCYMGEIEASKVKSNYYYNSRYL